MPSSTSSFKREIPDKPWNQLLISVFLITFFLIGMWEVFWRHKGITPSLNDTQDLWAENRSQLKDNGAVLIGSSRALFDLNLGVLETVLGKRPLQLSTVGTNPTPYLKDVAENTNFSGTLIIGVVPGLYFAPQGLPLEIPVNNLKHFYNRSPSQKIGHYFNSILQKKLAFLHQDDLHLNALLKQIPLKNRPKAILPPVLPPHFHHVDKNRQGLMTQKAATSKDLQNKIINIWNPLFTPPAPPPHLSKKQFMNNFQKHVDNVLNETKKHVQMIQKRGGKVVFLRLPSQGNVRNLERKFSPRKHFYDKIVEVSGAKGIHFEDYPELSKFNCPENSHLNKNDAEQFSKNLVPILKKTLETI